jgi:dienelactone hydrolase
MRQLTTLILCLLLNWGAANAAQVGPWDLDTLLTIPKWEETEKAAQEGMTGILYDSIPVNGKHVQVFAYYSAPKGNAPEEGWPAVVCVHGGGGTAFNEWVAKWNDHGYAAISMDLEGHYPIRENEEARSPRLPTENPGLSRIGIFGDYEKPIEQQWYYHAVAQVILAHSLIRSFSEVNPDKIGITGISWGGTLASTIMGVDNRFAFAIPVYGCGFLPDSDGNQGLAIKPGKYTDFVNRHFDGSAYFGNVKIPTFWVNGTNDTHFPMPSTQKSSRAVQGPATVRYELRMRHGHYPGWEPAEIYAFADSVVKQGPPLVQFGKPKLKGEEATVSFTSSRKVTDASFYYTKAVSAWPERLWEENPANLSITTLTATVPAGATAFYFSATDERGLMVSSDFVLTK